VKTTWVTFYSYKGGVGRTMALANVAGLLARSGRKVLMIDFDLEAPGLDSFREFSTEKLPGVVEYIFEFLQTKRTPPIGKFVHECPGAKDVRGKLWLMPAGCKDEHYPERLHSINWTDLYQQNLAQPLIANWKLAVERIFSPDYVFIDSRTGLTDVGGVCTLNFPDIDVLFFALNEQNIAGTAGVLRTISEASAIRPIDVLTVASPVPELTQEMSSIGERFAEIQNRLGGMPNSVIPYFGPVALQECVWTLDRFKNHEPNIIKAYAELASKIRERTKDGIDFYLSQGKQLLDTGVLKNAPVIIQALLEQYGERLESLKMAARLLRLQGSPKATEIAYRVLKTDPLDEDAFSWIVGHFKQDRDTLLTFIHSLAEQLKSMPPSRRWVGALVEIGHVYMQLKEYFSAAGLYALAAKHGIPGDPDIALRFNFYEAKRRATGSVGENLSDWQKLAKEAVELLDNILTLPEARADSSRRANYFQALSIAFAIAGDRVKAKELLFRAGLEGMKLNQTGRVFSVVEYDEIDRDPFLAYNQQMLNALEKGELWDGTKLSGTAQGLLEGYS